MKKRLFSLCALVLVCYSPLASRLPGMSIGFGTAAAQTVNPRTGIDPHRLNQLRDLKVVTIKANGHPIRVWLMDNESKRQEGMMFLQPKDIHADEGMLFVFPEVQPGDTNHGFWMHNCPCGLDICYIAANKKVLNVADGKPFNDTSLQAAGDYNWVLEMKTNCAKKLGIKHGTVLQIPAGLKSS